MTGSPRKPTNRDSEGDSPVKEAQCASEENRRIVDAQVRFMRKLAELAAQLAVNRSETAGSVDQSKRDS